MTGRKSQISVVAGRNLFSCCSAEIGWLDFQEDLAEALMLMHFRSMEVKFQVYFFAVQNEPKTIMYALSQSGVHHCKPPGVLLGQLREKNKEIDKVVTKEGYPHICWTSDFQTHSEIRNAHLFQ